MYVQDKETQLEMEATSEPSNHWQATAPLIWNLHQIQTSHILQLSFGQAGRPPQYTLNEFP